MSRTDTRVFDISSFTEHISSKNVFSQNNQNDETVFLTSTSLGIDPLDLELVDHLIEHINYLIQNFCVSSVS